MSKPKIRFKGYEEDWEQRKLSDLLYLSNEKNDGRYTKDDVLAASLGTELQKKQFYFGLKATDKSVKNYKVVKPTDVIYTKSPIKGFPNGIIRTSKGESGIVPTLYCVYHSVDEIDSSIIQSYFEDKERLDAYLMPLVNIGARNNVNITDKGFLEGTICIPKDKQEQVSIINVLASISELITLHQRKCEETKKLKKYMLQKMFPQNGKRVPEIRFAGFTDDWEQRKLSEIATMHARIGWQNLRTSEFLDSGDYMLITGTDFEDGTINYSTCHYVEKERYEQDKNIQIRNGSILITKDGTLGKVAYVQGLTMPATLNAGVFNVEIKDKKETDEKYLFQYLKAPFLMDYVTRHATGGTIKHLNQSILINFPVYMPKKSEQEKIGLYLMQLDSLITLHQRKYEELQKIKKFMLQNMFI